MIEETRQRSLELAEQRARATARRRQVQTERERLREHREEIRRGAEADGVPRAAVTLLERARALAGCGMDDLWLEYFALGGALRESALEAMLHGRRPMPRIDHDLIAAALNERFAEAGFGHPLDAAS